VNWIRSSFCDTGSCLEVAHDACDSSACAEVAHVDDQTYIRETRTGTILHLTAAEWDAFLSGAKAGEFDRGGQMGD
jgi:hypothetical protein